VPALLALAAAAFALAPGASADLEADVVELSAGQLVARGHVVLRDGARRLDADEITVALAEGAAVAVHARVSLEAGGTCRPLAAADRMVVRADGSAVLEGAVAWPCACGSGAVVRVTAPRVTLTAGGRAVLHGALLRAGPVPLFWLPWLSVPADGRGSGFLLPSIAYGGRDGLALRAGAFFELGARADVTVHAAWRSGRGFLPEARLRLPGVDAAVLLLVDPGAPATPAPPPADPERRLLRGAVRADLSVHPLPGLAAGGTVRASGDRRFGEDVSSALSDRAARANVTDLVARYTALASPRSLPLEVSARLRAYQDLAGGPAAGPAVHALPEARVVVGPLPVVLRPRLVPLLEASAGVAQALWLPAGATRWADRMRADARLGVVLPIGVRVGREVVSAELLAVTHRGLLDEAAAAAGGPRESLSYVGARFGLEARFPLARGYATPGALLRHEVTPYMLARLVGLDHALPTSIPPLDDLDRVAGGVAAALGVHQRILVGGREILRTDLALLDDWATLTPVLLASADIGGWPAFGLHGLVVYELPFDGRVARAPSELRLSAAFALPSGAGFSVRYLKLAADGPARLFRDDPRSPLYLGATPSGTPLAPLSEIAVAAGAPLGPLLLTAAVRLDVRRATFGSAGPGLVTTDAALSWRARCGCFAATLRAAYAPGQPAPDVALLVDVAPLGMAPRP